MNIIRALGEERVEFHVYKAKYSEEYAAPCGTSKSYLIRNCMIKMTKVLFLLQSDNTTASTKPYITSKPPHMVLSFGPTQQGRCSVVRWMPPRSRFWTLSRVPRRRPLRFPTPNRARKGEVPEVKRCDCNGNHPAKSVTRA